MSTCFVAGIVKGLVEANDATRHFGSLMGFQAHLMEARSCGVVEGDGRGVRVTEKGRDWYEQKRMSELPQGRAYIWSLVRKDDWTMTPNAELSGPRPLAAGGSRSNDVLAGTPGGKD